MVCGVGFGATVTYEEQHARLLDRGLRALSPLGIPMVMPNSVAAHLSMRFGFRGPCLTVSAACASGATAIGEGVELLRRGAADLVLAGGVDAMLSLQRDLLVPAARRDEPQRRRPGARVPPVRRRP